MSSTLVAVVGSTNLDIVTSVLREPAPGETVLATDYVESPGGKGLNQACAAARVAPSSLVACIGGDAAGEVLRAYAVARGVGVTELRVVPGPSGRAMITVTPDGENRIAVAALANRFLDGEAVTEALDRLRPAVVLCQQEIAADAVEAAAGWVRANGSRFVLNPSPVRPVGTDLLAACDPLVLNEAEALAALDQLGEDTGPGSPPEDLAAALARYCASVIVTAGRRGAYVAEPGGVRHVAGEAVLPVDTTGAGDEFAGVLAAHLATGATLRDAATAANARAARTVAVHRRDR